MVQCRAPVCVRVVVRHSSVGRLVRADPFRGSPMGPRPLHYLSAVVTLTAVYFAAAKLGLSMAGAFEQVTPVWPPTGIAIAAVLLLGYRVWPGIALGAFLANATANEPPLVAVGVATGNTLEALSAAWLLNRLLQFDPRFGRMTNAIGFV